jgi:hypothetical protein
MDSRAAHSINPWVPFGGSAMRIWDLPVECLCRSHQLAEHRELHAIWSIILNEKVGYSKHPETLRWRGRLSALWTRHEDQVAEMVRRGYSHKSPLDLKKAPRQHRGLLQTNQLDTLEEQRRNLRKKGCACNTVRDEVLLRTKGGREQASSSYCV